MFKTSTVKTPTEYIAQLSEPRRTDIRQLHDLIRKTVPKLRPHIQSGMIGYGTYHYKYASGREGDWPIVALASNKHYISVYVHAVVDGQYVAEKHKKALPKASIGKSCIRFKRLDDIDPAALQKVIREGARAMSAQA